MQTDYRCIMNSNFVDQVLLLEYPQVLILAYSIVSEYIHRQLISFFSKLPIQSFPFKASTDLIHIRHCCTFFLTFIGPQCNYIDLIFKSVLLYNPQNQQNLLCNLCRSYDNPLKQNLRCKFVELTMGARLNVQVGMDIVKLCIALEIINHFLLEQFASNIAAKSN